jgi:hypothetical protein
MTSRLHTLALFFLVLCAYVYVNDPGHVFHTDASIGQNGVTVNVDAYTTNTPDNTAGHNIFNPAAPVSMDQIEYSDDTPVILPTGAMVITPTILLDGTYVPEESPDGGSPVGWADNSPVYSDGWMLQVNDSTGITSWIAPTPADFGAGSGAVCGTDAQCADYSRSIGEEPSGYAQGK